jgi:hypothetical protein
MCKLPGCSSTSTVVPTESGAITAVAVQAGTVYWANNGTGPLSTDGALRKCVVATPCAPVDLASASRTFDVLLTGTTAYWTTTGAVDSCPAAGCSGQPLAVDDFQFQPAFLTADPTSLFFTTRDGAIKSVPKTGPASSEHIYYQQRSTYPWDIAIDPQAIYWTDLNGVDGAPGTALFKIAR